MKRPHPLQRHIRGRYLLAFALLALFAADRVAAGVQQCAVLGCLPSW